MSTALCLFRTLLYHRLTQYLGCRLPLQLCSSTSPSMVVWLPLATASAGISQWLAAPSLKVRQPQINLLPSDAFITCFSQMLHWYLILWSFNIRTIDQQDVGDSLARMCHFDNRHTQHCIHKCAIFFTAVTLIPDPMVIQPCATPTLPTLEAVLVKDYQALSITLPVAMVTILLVVIVVSLGVFLCLRNRTWK